MPQPYYGIVAARGSWIMAARGIMAGAKHSAECFAHTGSWRRDAAPQESWMLTIDLDHLGRPRVIAAYALPGEGLLLVDPGPAITLPTLAAGLATHGQSLDDLRAILLTHIHLDHAGATGTLIGRYPRTQVFVHERGAPHVIDPSRLLASAGRLYGDRMDALYGEMLPVSEANVHVLQGGETLGVAGRSFRVLYAPGHASHHVVYQNLADGAAFVGDVAGLRSPFASYVRPATPPPEIDLDRWETTLDALLALDPQALCLTHFGVFTDVQRHIAEQRQNHARWGSAVLAALRSGADEATQMADLRAFVCAELGSHVDPALASEYETASPLELNVAGLMRYWRKRDPSLAG
jgi:glyoxylase-like metal-dependent hydrolase (beta-lactamase superfamily II)